MMFGVDIYPRVAAVDAMWMSSLGFDKDTVGKSVGLKDSAIVCLIVLMLGSVKGPAAVIGSVVQEHETGVLPFSLFIFPFSRSF